MCEACSANMRAMAASIREGRGAFGADPQIALTMAVIADEMASLVERVADRGDLHTSHVMPALVEVASNFNGFHAAGVIAHTHRPAGPFRKVYASQAKEGFDRGLARLPDIEPVNDVDRVGFERRRSDVH